MSAGEALERARAFLAGGKNEPALTAAAVLGSAAAREELLESLAARQLPDGACAAPEAPDEPSLAACASVLARLDDALALDGPVARGLCAHLAAAQAPDGSWGGGHAGSRCRLTGRLVAHLVRAPSARTAVLEAAADFLASTFAPERVQGFAYPALVAFAPAFANLAHDAGDGILQWCGRELERGFRSRRFGPAACARLLVWCDAPALPGARVGAAELVEALLEAQAPDGGWPDEGAGRAESTLGAVVGLVRLGGA